MNRLIYSIAIVITLTNANAQVLINNVNVLDVENKKILSGYDVVALDGKIVSVSKDRKYKLPAGTEVIDGSGKFLSPGFSDAHIHFFQSGGLYARPDVINLEEYRSRAEEIKWTHQHYTDFQTRYLSQGITSVTDVGATLNFLKIRDSLASKNPSPLISMTGPLLTTWIPPAYKNMGNDGPFIEMTSIEAAVKGVQDQLAYKPDFIKIWYVILDKDKEAGAKKFLSIVQAAITEAHKHNLRVAVHATEKITALLSVQAGADFLVHSIDDELMGEDFIRLLKDRKTVIIPTLEVGNNYSKVFGKTYTFSTEELRYAHPVTVASILNYPWPDTTRGNLYINSIKKNGSGAAARTDSIMATNLKKMAAAGVIIAAGTDAGNIGTQHATSFFPELIAMKRAGMDNWQILQAATVNGAKAVGKEKEWGTITAGKVSNMVLLNSNPIESLENLKDIHRVIVKGFPINPDSLIALTPEMLVQQQLNAYNAHNLDAFLEPYAEDVEIFTLQGKLLMKGKETMRKEYQFITKMPNLYCKLLNRMVIGNTVIDHEEVWIDKEPDNRQYAGAIYTIDKGKISKVHFTE